MKTFTNKNAIKSLRQYGLLYLAALACLIGVGIAIYNGMGFVNELIQLEPKLASKRVYIFMHYQRAETLIICVLMVAAIYSLGLALIRSYQFFLYFHKHGKDQMEVLDREMNRSRATWLPKSRTYLTDNYIISFRGAFTAVRYIDVFWLYQNEQRENGVKTKISLTALLPDGKRHEVANCVPHPAAEDELLMIIGTVAEQNPNVLIGYSNENITASKEIIKSMKAH